MTQLVDLSRRACRALQLGKGMFFDAGSMELLAEIGAIELLQQRTAEELKERAAERRAAREERPSRQDAPRRAKVFDTGPIEESGQVLDKRARRSLGVGPSGDRQAEAREALERARRTLGMRPKSNVVKFKPR